MKKILFIFVLFFCGCKTNPEYKEIILNKSVKVFSKLYHDNAENYIFKWKPPLDPNNQAIPFDLKNDMLIFSPTIEGIYEIHLSIIDISNELIAEETFYFDAILGNKDIAPLKNKIENKDTKNKTINKQSKDKVSKTTNNKKTKNVAKKQKKNVVGKQKKSTTSNNKIINKNNKSANKTAYFTIQIASWPSLELARSNQISLLEEGVDAYIERYYKKNNDEIWYRVRAGKFISKNDALSFQNQIDNITGKDSWLDIIYNK